MGVGPQKENRGMAVMSNSLTHLGHGIRRNAESKAAVLVCS